MTHQLIPPPHPHPYQSDLTLDLDPNLVPCDHEASNKQTIDFIVDFFFLIKSLDA